MSRFFNPPPNWPTPPEGWEPPPGWQPHPSWGEPPAGWQLWVKRRLSARDRRLWQGLGDDSSSPAAGYGVNGDHTKAGGEGLLQAIKHSQFLLLFIAALVLAIGISFNLSPLSIRERELSGSPQAINNGIRSEIDGSTLRQNMPSTTEAESLSLKHSTGEGEPNTYSGVGEKYVSGEDPLNNIVLEKPDGPLSPAWVEYSVTTKNSMFRSPLLFSDNTDPYQGRYYSFSVEHEFEQAEVPAEATLEGSFWIAGDKDPTMSLDGVKEGDRWSITVHSAKDAPVLRPGQTISGDKNSGPQAYRYVSDRPTTVTGTFDLSPDDDDYRLDTPGATLQWTDADDAGRIHVTQQSLLAVGQNMEDAPASLSQAEGSTQLLRGDYLLDTVTRNGDWSFSFGEQLGDSKGGFVPYELKPAPALDHIRRETLDRFPEPENITLAADPKGPRLLDYRADGPQSGNAFSIYSSSEESYLDFRVQGWQSYDNYRGVQLIPADLVSGGFSVESQRNWELSTYGLEALPTYGPGEAIEGVGPALFYFDGSQDITARLDRVNNGDAWGRSGATVYSAGGPVDNRFAEDWGVLYSTSLSADRASFKLTQGEPTVIYLEVSPTNSWKLSF